MPTSPPSADSGTLTLGISPCPNDIYIFAGLILGRVTWDGPPFAVCYEDVETLNGLARSGALDFAKISYANYTHVERDYELLESGGALGRGVGPLLLANGASSVDLRRPILVPGAYTTANFLLDFYLAGDSAAEVEKCFQPFDTLYETLCSQTGAQGVVIHEKRFTYARDGLTLIQDLGEWWEAHTGHPIPLGAIAARRSLGLSEKMNDLVRRSLDWSDSHVDEALALCQEYSKDMDPEVVRAHAELYVNKYSHELGEDGRAAVSFFLGRQKRIV